MSAQNRTHVRHCSLELAQPCFELSYEPSAPSHLAAIASLGVHNLIDHQPNLLPFRPQRSSTAPLPPHAAPHKTAHPTGTNSDASKLTAQLHGIEAVGPLGRPQTPKTTTSHKQDQLRSSSTEQDNWLSKFSSMLQPQGDTHNDNQMDQRVVNVLTSLPFLAVGVDELRKRKTVEGKQHAMSLIAVGGVASAYHASSGNTRIAMRKLDYWTIAASSVFMGKALWPDKKWAQQAMNLSMLAIPFKPLLISTVNILLMQSEFVRQAKKHTSVRRDLKLHLAAAAGGAVAFATEDILAERGFGHMHSIWHMMAAASVASMSSLVKHKENLRLAKSLPAIERIKPLKNCHDSARSLQSLI